MMRRYLLAATLVLLELASQSSTAQVSVSRSRAVGKSQNSPPVYAESHALVIGISDYLHWRKLPGVVEDIPAVAALFKRQGFVVETPQIKTRAEFRQELDRFISRHGSNEKNRLLIYFAGHGHTETRRDGVQVGSIVMSDAPKDPQAPGFDLSLVTMDELNADAIRIRANQVLFIFDSCFAGTIFTRSNPNARRIKSSPLILAKAAAPVRQFITSGTDNQEVLDRSDFRVLLERAFDYRAADFDPQDGYITGEELGKYLAGQLSTITNGEQTPMYGKIRGVPRLNGGDMVFQLPAIGEVETEVDKNDDQCELAWKELERAPSESGMEIFLKDCSKSKWKTTAEIRLAGMRDGGGAKPSQPERETVELEYWKSIGGSQNAKEYESYLRQYPNGQFVELARNRIEKLKQPVYRSVKYETGELKGRKLTRRQGECEVYTEELGNGVKLEMVKIPGGDFQMGSPASEKGRFDDEGPLHRVTVKEFLMGRYEVTQKIWRAVAALPKIGMELNPDPSRFKGDELPVETVSWDEVKEFIGRLNQKLGLEESKGYRLPSEAEWEYAARGGTTTPFGFGETISLNMVNYNGKYPYGEGEKGEDRGRTIGVGSLGLANRFGLYEMHGNVYEWCEDQYRNNYSGAPVDGTAWTGLEMAADRVNRGGGWDIRAAACRSARRPSNAPGIRYNDLGFRLARTLP
jgi:formylglycine-generating enzyme required for sulfatase activity